MTLTYSGSFHVLLFRWRGSVWKTVSVELILFLLAYYAINLPYRFAMTDTQKRRFEEIVVYVNQATAYIPLTFVLGFYVSQVMSRWYTSFNAIPWTDSLMMRVLTYMPQPDEQTIIVGRRHTNYRRTIARWALAAIILNWRLVTIRIRKRFPTLKHIQKAGFLTEAEVQILEDTPNKHGNWFVPLTWILNLTDSLLKKEVLNATGQREIMVQCDVMRENLQKLLIQDWIVIPLVYTQVVAVAVYGYFSICLLGRQLLDESQKLAGYEIDHYFPIFTVLQFVFYLGWMKVGQDLMRPFGEDDDDFEFNYLLERHTHVSFMYCSQLVGVQPECVKDRYWGIKAPEIPYTTSSLLRPDIIPRFNVPARQLRRIDENDTVLVEDEEIQRFLNDTNNWHSKPFSMFTRKAKVIELKKKGKVRPVEEPNSTMAADIIGGEQKDTLDIEKEEEEEPASTMAADIVDGEVKHELESESSARSVDKPAGQAIVLVATEQPQQVPAAGNGHHHHHRDSKTRSRRSRSARNSQAVVNVEPAQVVDDAADAADD